MSTCHQTISVDLNRISQESQIYQLKSDDKLYDYHKAINNACFLEAMKDPTLLKNKHELQKLARQQLHDSGFQYKKGKSRSTFCSPDSSTSSSTTRNWWVVLLTKKNTKLLLQMCV